ncbi:protein FAM72B-like [Bolinopsis microptera]|uniref:protein FAM72B-like n=1 Tax=Bolinopsis microptera TaxID=2820187 RepID=UPI0030792E9F
MPYNQTQTFFHKRVVKLECRHCMNILCWRGMRAILLADTSIELYSTDLPPPNAVEMSGDDYCTSNCACHIRDLVCAGCGNQVGYHVTLPCRNCMDSCNNGHFWMFHALECKEVERMDDSGKHLIWGKLPPTHEDLQKLKDKTSKNRSIFPLYPIECIR